MLAAAQAAEAANAIDVGVLIVLAVAFIYGLVRGFVLQLAGIVFLVAGLILGDQLSPAFGRKLHAWFGLGSPVDRYVAFFVIVLGVILGGHIVALIFRSLLEKLKLLSYDRFLGGVLGMIKGALVIVLALFVLLWFFDRREEGEAPAGISRTIYESRTWPLVQKASDTVLPLVPEELREKTRKGLEEIRKHVPAPAEEAEEPPESS